MAVPIDAPAVETVPDIQVELPTPIVEQTVLPPIEAAVVTAKPMEQSLEPTEQPAESWTVEVESLATLEPPGIEALSMEILSDEEPIVLYERGTSDQTETAELPEPVIESEPQQPLAELLPETVQERLAAYEEIAEPEELAVVNELVTAIETVTVELLELYRLDNAEEDQITEAEESIAELYEQLLLEIGIEDIEKREELVRQFIAELKVKAVLAKDAEQARIVGEDEGTREAKRNLTDPVWSRGVSALIQLLLGRFTVKQTGLYLLAQ